MTAPPGALGPAGVAELVDDPDRDDRKAVDAASLPRCEVAAAPE